VSRPGANPSADPVRVKRAQIAKWTLLANRVGYLFFAVAMAVFFIGFALRFNGAVVAIVVGCMIAGSILLAPALVVGYGIKKAEREDVARGL
jgi:uncharacterized membrane protein